MKLRLLCCALLTCILIGCAAGAYRTQKFSQPEQPINEIKLKLSFGDISTVAFASQKSIDAYKNVYIPAFLTRVPQTFESNQIRVTKVIVGRDPNPTDTKYQISIDAVTFSKISGGPEFVDYNISLLDTQNRKLIWTAQSSVSINSLQPLLRSEKLAGDILNSMNKDGLIKLTDGYSKNAKGEKITDVFKYSEDK